MSTNINISVGDNKLLDQARLQQNASRQAQLEKEASKRLQGEAEMNRVNALAAQGKDANGNPLTGTRFQVPQLDRRPAANRAGGIYELLITPTPDSPTGTFQAELRNAKVKPLLFADQSSPQAIFYAGTGGPTGGAYLNCQVGGGKEAKGIGTTTEDLVFDKPDPAASRTDFTVECWAYIDNDNNLILDNLLYPYEQTLTGALNTDSTGNAKMRLQVFFDRRYVPGFGPSLTINLYRKSAFSGFTEQWREIFGYSYYDPSGPVTGGDPPEVVVREGGTLTPNFAPVVVHSTWIHLAVVRRSNVLSLFINGNKMGEYPEYTDSATYLEPLDDSGSLLTGASFSTGFDNLVANNRVANVRVRKKAVYTENFNPLLVT